MIIKHIRFNNVSTNITQRKREIYFLFANYDSQQFIISTTNQLRMATNLTSSQVMRQRGYVGCKVIT